MIGARFESNGRKLTITASYDGSRGPDDRPGYYYRYDGDNAVHWITASGAAVRFTKLEETHDANDVDGSAAP